MALCCKSSGVRILNNVQRNCNYIIYLHNQSRQALQMIQHPYNWYHVSYLRVCWLGFGIDHPAPSSTEVKESVEVHLYFF